MLEGVVTVASRRRTPQEPAPKRRRPATTPEGRENQLISAAVELAERRIAEGTASAQEIVHFLKLGSSRERLEQERLSHENQLLQARTEALASQKKVEELYAAALNAMRSYSGQEVQVSHDDYED